MQLYTLLQHLGTPYQHGDFTEALCNFEGLADVHLTTVSFGTPRGLNGRALQRQDYPHSQRNWIFSHSGEYKHLKLAKKEIST